MPEDVFNPDGPRALILLAGRLNPKKPRAPKKDRAARDGDKTTAAPREKRTR